MNAERSCCDGLCNQGRDCPRYAPTPEQRMRTWRVIVWAVVACVIVGSLIAYFR